MGKPFRCYFNIHEFEFQDNGMNGMKKPLKCKLCGYEQKKDPFEGWGG